MVSPVRFRPSPLDNAGFRSGAKSGSSVTRSSRCFSKLLLYRAAFGGHLKSRELAYGQLFFLYRAAFGGHLKSRELAYGQLFFSGAIVGHRRDPDHGRHDQPEHDPEDRLVEDEVADADVAEVDCDEHDHRRRREYQRAQRAEVEAATKPRPREAAEEGV